MKLDYYSSSDFCRPLVIQYEHVQAQGENISVIDRHIPSGYASLVFNSSGRAAIHEEPLTHLPRHFMVVPLFRAVNIGIYEDLDSFIITCQASALSRLLSLNLSSFKNDFYRRSENDGLNYYPVERKKEQAEIKPTIKPGLYFDMKLVSAIHHECNNVQFENMTEVDFYAILNLQPTNIRFIVKSGERTRMCYLIYRLYEFLKTGNKAEWRTDILKSADIKDTYYKAKYKEPESEIPSRKSESFAQRINKIFEYLS